MVQWPLITPVFLLGPLFGRLLKAFWDGIVFRGHTLVLWCVESLDRSTICLNDCCIFSHWYPSEGPVHRCQAHEESIEGIFFQDFIKDGKMRSRWWWFKIFLIFYPDPWKMKWPNLTLHIVFQRWLHHQLEMLIFFWVFKEFWRFWKGRGEALEVLHPSEESSRIMEVGAKIKLPQVFACCLCGRVTEMRVNEASKN